MSHSTHDRARAHYMQGLARYSDEQRRADDAAIIAEIGADVGCVLLSLATEVDGVLRVSPDTVEAVREEYRERCPDDTRWASVVGSALTQLRRQRAFHVLPLEA